MKSIALAPKPLVIIFVVAGLASGCKKADSPPPTPVPKAKADFSFTIPAAGILPTTVDFSSASQNADTYRWYFDNGNSSSDQNPIVAYTAAKTYNVKLVVTNSVGSDSITKPVVITLNKPKADFSFTSTNVGANPTTITFTNSSTGASTYQWFFDNGDTSSKTNPSENYIASKTYNVKLIAINEVGKDSIIKQVVVNIPKSTAKNILSFSFLKSNNPALVADITGKINGNKISVNVLNGFSKNLIATYSNSAKSTVYVGTAVQQSGTTANDFSYTLEYQVKAEDSSLTSFFVDVQRDSFPAMDQAITNFMTQHQITGLSLTVVKNDKLVYENSYGFGDVEDNQPTNNANLFRIGSISKLITRIGILKFQDLGLLTLNQTVFGTNGILGNDFGVPKAGTKINQITVNQLLNHTSGWAYNPFGEPLGWTTDQMITDMVTDSALEYNPGDTSIYLSFGYEVLGRIIQKLSHQAYGDYCQQNFFTPSGITDMSLAKTILANRQPHEVKYYSAQYSPYDPSIEWEKWPAAAGWIATAKDLASYITRIDTDPYHPDLLSLNILNQNYFGGVWAYNGARNGTAALLSRIDANFSFSICINYDLDTQGFTDLQALMTQVIHARTSWPTYDLF